jgi:hypothetical protein
MKHWIVLGSEDDGEILIDEIRAGADTRWTTHKDAAIGDTVYFYIVSPVSSVVASGKICNTPQLQDAPSFPWYGYYFADINELKLTEPVHISILRKLFPDWAYWRYPRRNSEIPAQFLEAFQELTNGV